MGYVGVNRDDDEACICRQLRRLRVDTVGAGDADNVLAFVVETKVVEIECEGCRVEKAVNFEFIAETSNPETNISGPLLFVWRIGRTEIETMINRSSRILLRRNSREPSCDIMNIFLSDSCLMLVKFI
ncbi:MAG: hypothetical protein ACI8RD_000824 [Bacillariaceae sp.]|jgi:hypothetical protein